jgi:hypothetical protein
MCNSFKFKEYDLSIPWILIWMNAPRSLILIKLPSAVSNSGIVAMEGAEISPDSSGNIES